MPLRVESLLLHLGHTFSDFPQFGYKSITVILFFLHAAINDFSNAVTKRLFLIKRGHDILHLTTVKVYRLAWHLRLLLQRQHT